VSYNDKASGHAFAARILEGSGGRMQALDGIRVLDLTHALAGPFCTYQLQLLGAEVIKIEKPGAGDDFRDFARLPGWDASPSFIAVNGGKRSVTVNLKSAEGRALVLRLAQTADVVVENLRPGAARAMGLGWEDLKAANPRLIYCSISGFGQVGEMSRWPAYDHTIKAMSGMMWDGGDEEPSQARGFSVDCFSGYLAYSTILSALLRRERTGEGQNLDVAMLDASFVMMGVGLTRQLITGDDVSAVQPIAHDRPTVAPYRTRDGWIWLSGNFQNHYEALCRVIGAPELAADPRFRDVASRNANSEALKAELAARLKAFSAAELEPALMAAGMPAAQVRTSRQAMDIPALSERAALVETVTADGKAVSLVNAGFVADADGPGLQGPPPSLGADTEAVLTELGLAAAEIADLRRSGAI
jgi:crotonobetainyl-CoA:carnitine CoA-transferase CaiB-like acyl-CoA transferase